EHGTMFTLALVRFPPTATKEIQYLNAKGALTYTDIAGDPVLYGNLPPREIDRKSGSAGMPRPISYAVFCLKKKKNFKGKQKEIEEKKNKKSMQDVVLGQEWRERN